ncbi:MAG: 1-acyl-sn-glycerol-3-phosphate acyltransferase [Sporichthya sp.]|nr:1-acyl-sn-glycerol-3-phosphate acyltransferase [Sporichthya sp.]
MARDRKRGWFRVAEVLLIPPMLVLMKRRWHGRGHIPRTGGAIVVANHISKIDPITFGHFVHGAGRVPHYLAKVELFEHTVLGRIFRGTDMIPVYRGGENAGASVQAAVQAVRDGLCIVVYAEATITRDPNLWPMVGKSGAARIALESGAPVIPVAQWGAHRILAPYSKRPSFLPRKTVHVRAGEPVHLADLAGRELTPEVLAEATERIMAAITAELEVIRAERAPAIRFDPRRAGVAEYGNPHGRDSAEDR